jgi:uncharacterized protein YecT (DUF1311 family)
MRTAIVGAFVGAALIVGPAAAASPAEIEARYSQGFTDCIDRAAATADQIQCTVEEHALQDRALNAAYARAMKQLTPDQQAKLKAAQRAWIPWRDAKCAALEDIGWGSLSRVSANFCMVETTIERTLELEAYPPYE